MYKSNNNKKRKEMGNGAQKYGISYIFFPQRCPTGTRKALQCN